MRKLISFLIVFSLVFSLAACGKELADEITEKEAEYMTEAENVTEPEKDPESAGPKDEEPAPGTQEPAEPDAAGMSEPEGAQEPGPGYEPTEGAPPVGERDAAGYEEQLALIADRYDDWWDGEEAEYANYAAFAVTDLDGNGRLEVIFSTVQGTGHYSYSHFYEVNETKDGLDLCELASPCFTEGDSEPDIAVTDAATAYYDKTADLTYYLFNDWLRASATDYYSTDLRLLLTDGTVTAVPFRSMLLVYGRGNDPITTCYDGEGNEISQAEWEGMEDTWFSILDIYDKYTATFRWVAPAYEEGEPYDLVSRSFMGFTVAPAEG